MKTLITICARGGSKGVPGKNIKSLGGKPLIAYSIDVANKFKDKYKSVDIALSTDSDEIRDVALKLGLKSSYKRPKSLAGDTIGKIDAIKDILQFSEKENGTVYDFVLDLDVTSPLRNLDDLVQAFELLKKDEQALNIFSVSTANRSPYFNMVEQKENGYYGLVKKLENTILTRQSAPEVFDLNASFYVYKKNFFDMNYKGAIANKSLVYLVPHMCFDLDHLIDFEFMNYLLENNKLDFSL